MGGGGGGGMRGREGGGRGGDGERGRGERGRGERDKGNEAIHTQRNVKPSHKKVRLCQQPIHSSDKQIHVL